MLLIWTMGNITTSNKSVKETYLMHVENAP